MMVRRRKFNYRWGKVSRFQRLFPNPSWLVWGRASRHQKLAPTFPWLDNCLMVTKRDFLKTEASLWLNEKSRVSLRLVVYLMLLGSSRPYPWLFWKKWMLSWWWWWWYELHIIFVGSYNIIMIIIDVANVQNVLYNFWKEHVLLRSFWYHFWRTLANINFFICPLFHK